MKPTVCICIFLSVLSLSAESIVDNGTEKGALVEATHDGKALNLLDGQRKSRRLLIQNLKEASDPIVKRQLLEQLRELNRSIIDQEPARTASNRSLGQIGSSWTRPGIPDNVPNEVRERLSLRYDMMEARQALVSKLKDGSPEERRQAIEDLRQQNATRLERLHGLSKQTNDLSRSSLETRIIPLLPIAEDLPAEQKARLEARNERVAALNVLNEALDGGSAEERRAALGAFREFNSQYLEKLESERVVLP